MRVILLGPPGAGKGTQAARLAERFAVPHVATGDLLRAEKKAGTDVGRVVAGFMDRGELVPDGITLAVLEARLKRPDAEDGFILDGFPRNAVQAEALDKMLAEVGQGIDAVLAFDVSDQAMIDRLSVRRSCPACQRVYNLATNPPAEDERCDADGSPLYLRDDDEPEVIRRRMQVYRRATAPLIERYEAAGLLARIDGTGTVDEVGARIDAAVPG